ncbi:MAG: hypothetical protein KatS3mg114_1263 [Planctomycetaceae bacterium]|nr:MAG: hypothetical protein KatS3mg114_1263 [Planctomycetaceae bacterium]
MLETGPIREIPNGMLQDWMLRVLQRLGMFAADAELVVLRTLEAAVHAPRWGWLYFAQQVHAVHTGDIDPRARLLTVHETPHTAILDGSQGWGAVAVTRAMQHAQQKAQETGIGWVWVKHTTPAGAGTLYVTLAAQHGFWAGFSMSAGKAQWPEDQPTFGHQVLTWGCAVDDTILLADSQSDTIPSPPLAWFSLLWTSVWLGSKLPWEKRKSSLTTAGADHCCVVLMPEKLGSHAWEERLSVLRQHMLGLGSEPAGLQYHPLENWRQLPHTFRLSAEEWQALGEAGESCRIPLPSP